MDGADIVSAAGSRPAFYAVGRGSGGSGDWVTLLHPPYTLWHLSYVAIGAALVPDLDVARLAGTLLAFFFAVGIGAHALDELKGRPLRTGISTRALWAAAVCSVGLAVAMGLTVGGLRLLPFIVLGALFVFGYNLELFGGRMHNAAGFAAAWGAFPVLVGGYAQHWTLPPAVCVGAVAAFLFSLAQRALSTPARMLRRRVGAVSVRVTFDDDGHEREFGRPELLAPLEQALKHLAWAMVVLAVTLVLAAL